MSLGVLPWGLAMVLWMWVLNRLEVGQVSASIYLLPFFGLGLSVLTVHDRISCTRGSAVHSSSSGRSCSPCTRAASRSAGVNLAGRTDDDDGVHHAWSTMATRVASRRCGTRSTGRVYWTDTAGRFFSYDWSTS